MSVDPYMRGRMSAAKSYAEPYQVGETMWGGAVGEVVSSTVDHFRPGDMVAEQLAAAAPEGIDVYFDNVGGEHLEAAIGAMNMFGRIAACGMISGYNATEPRPGPRNMMKIVGWRLRIRGFIVTDHGHLREQFQREVGGWLREGRLHHKETVVDGLRNAPRAFLDLLSGANTGKMLVRLGS